MQQVQRDQQVLKDKKDKLVLQVVLDLQDLQDQVVVQVLKDKKVHQELVVEQDRLGLQGQLVVQAPKDKKELQVV